MVALVALPQLFEYMFSTFQKVFYDFYDVVEDETKQVKYSEIWSKFQSSEDYCGLKSRRAKQEYGRDELYKWLGKYKMVEDFKSIKYAVGVVGKNAESSVNL